MLPFDALVSTTRLLINDDESHCCCEEFEAELDFIYIVIDSQSCINSGLPVAGKVFLLIFLYCLFCVSLVLEFEKLKI